MPAPPQRPRRIVVTGGPGGGKTTAADLFRRGMGKHLVLVPEVATMLFASGFPRSRDPLVVQAAQRAIFHLQKELEQVHEVLHPDCLLLCDRGTVDGAAYWPGSTDDFFATQGTTLVDELARYDAVLFFESAALGGMGIQGGNATRDESAREAIALDQRLRALWSQHPHFILVPHQDSFFQKISVGFAALESLLAELKAD